MTQIPDPLDNQVREPTEPETRVARISADTVAELKAKLIAAHIAQDVVDQVIRAAGPIFQAALLRLLST